MNQTLRYSLGFYLALVCLCGCEDPDPAGKLRGHFEDLKRETQTVDSLLASINDQAQAMKVIPELEKHMLLMREAGLEIERTAGVQSRSAITLLNEIDDFRRRRKAFYPDEMRRLSKIPGVEELLIPILMGGAEDAANAPAPPPF